MSIRFFLVVLALVASGHIKAYQINSIGDGLYRFVDDRHRSVFLVTDDGIVVTDPLNEDAARWLKRELNERFDVPVRYVIYSHNHSDHIYGSEVFDDPGVVFISHELTRQDIVLTSAETVVPTLVFRDFIDIEIGGKSIELRYHGPNDGRGSISMLFPDHEAIFVVDWIVLGRMPWQKLWSYDIRGMMNSTEDILSLNFNTFIGGHGDIGSKKDVERYMDYLNELHAAVVDGINDGKSLNEIKKDIDLPDYKGLEHYEEWLPLNVEGVYEHLMDRSGMGWRP